MRLNDINYFDERKFINFSNVVLLWGFLLVKNLKKEVFCKY